MYIHKSLIIFGLLLVNSSYGFAHRCNKFFVKTNEHGVIIGIEYINNSSNHISNDALAKAVNDIITYVTITPTALTYNTGSSFKNSVYAKYSKEIQKYDSSLITKPIERPVELQLIRNNNNITKPAA